MKKQLLLNMKKYLKSDGYIISSIPNVMHYSVIADLINGNWSYKDAGILDRTHVRFFTLNEIKKMFNSAGLEIVDVSSNVLPHDDSVDKYIDYLTALSNLGDRSQFETYQYLIKAKK